MCGTVAFLLALFGWMILEIFSSKDGGEGAANAPTDHVHCQKVHSPPYVLRTLKKGEQGGEKRSELLA